jgi:hypothetical protein
MPANGAELKKQNEGASGSMTCPRCNNSEFAKLSLVYERSVGQIRSQGFRAGAGSVEAAYVRQQRLSLMQRSAPPRRAAVKPLVMIGGAAIAISGFSASALLFVVLLVVGLAVALRYNTIVWPRSYARWTRKELCGRCGTIVAPPAGPTPLVPQRGARVVSVRVGEPPRHG